MQAQTETRYMISVRGRKARFIWSSTPNKPVKGSVDFTTRVDPSELLWMAEKLNCTVNGNRIMIKDIDSYNRLLLYSAVRSTIKDKLVAEDLAYLILNLSGYDAHYWASALRSVWWKYGDNRHVTRIAKAFKIFFNIGWRPI